MRSPSVALIGRVLLAALFVLAGFTKFTALADTAGYIASRGLPMPDVLAVLTAALELIAGIALAIGWQARWAALALALLTLAATFLFHAFWAMPADQQMIQQQMFTKNLAIVGGLLMVFTFGPGALSLDGQRSTMR